MTQTANQREIPILTYHQIAEAPPRGAVFRSLSVSPNRFRSQMHWLKRLGYQGLSMRELMPFLRGERHGRVVGITFDDGYLNNLSSALPVLQELGFTATCYVVSGLMGGSNVWDHALGVQPAQLMTAAQVRAWSDAGMEVGSHTCTHEGLDQLSGPALQDQLQGSRQALEVLLDQPVQQFCYPFGVYRPEQVALVREAGYLAATTTRRGRVRAEDDMFQLHRIPVVRSTSWPQFLVKLLSPHENRYRDQAEAVHG